MISVEDARARMVAAVRPVGTETVGLGEAWGRVLAAPVHARLSQPPADVSAMDGFAVRADAEAAGSRLRVIGTSQAGRLFEGSVGPGEAVRIFTGAVVPAGADRILIQENAEYGADYAIVREPCEARRHIRPAGQDFRQGDELLAPGRRLGPRDIGLAAAGNHPWLAVYRRPRIAILATGDEILMPGEAIGPGQIVSSNSHLLAAMVKAGGGEPQVMQVARDTMESIAASLRAAAGADLLVTTGGASVGDHDLVQAGLTAAGMTLDFWKIAMRPGKPLLFGELAGMPVLGLPGNPVSAAICAGLFLHPLIDILAGLPPGAPRRRSVRLGAPVRANDARADHLRATVKDGIATPFERQDSGMLTLLQRADALILRAPHAPALPAGAEVEILELDTLWL
jgi:molybdopterin molybdotransferase